MARNSKRMNFKASCLRRLDDKARIGSSKHDQQLRNSKMGKGYKSDYIHSVRTLQNYKDEVSRFVEWIKDNGYQYKSANEVSRQVLANYLHHQQARGLSAWSVHLSMSALNKAFDCNFTKKELGLDLRRISDITNNRGFATEGRQAEIDKNAEQIEFIRSVGCRREGVTNIKPSDCVRDNSGQIYAVRSVEKGGKVNTYYVLAEKQAAVTMLVNSKIEVQGENSPLFPPFDPWNHVNSHWYRNEYSCSLYDELQTCKLNNQPYYNSSPYRELYINESKLKYNIDRIQGDYYKGFDKELVALCSQGLGHYRLDVIVNHYLRQ